MKWNFYPLEIPSYAVCEYLILAIAALAILMVIILAVFIVKGSNMVSKEDLSGFWNKLAFVLDKRHMYGYVVTLRILSLITLPIGYWLMTDNFDQWFEIEGGSMWHSSGFGIYQFLPFLLLHVIMVAISIWDKKRPEPEKSIQPIEVNSIEHGYHPERCPGPDAEIILPVLKNNIVPFPRKSD